MRPIQALQEVAIEQAKLIVTATLSKMTETYGRSPGNCLNKSLVTPTEDDYKNCGGLDVGVYFGDRKELGKTHTICTWQSFKYFRQETQVR